MSTLALIAAAPVALVQSDAALIPPTIAQVPAAQISAGQISAGQISVAQFPVAHPLARAEVVRLAPQVAFGLPLPGSTGDFSIQAEGLAVPQPQAPTAQPAAVTYSLAAADEPRQGPPSPDPMANDIAWANGQTAQHRAEVAREGWRKIIPYEIAWQLLNVLDAAQTIDCAHKPTCREANPLFGSRPSDGTVIGIKGGMAVVHFLLMRHLAHRNWKTARAAEIGTILVQGVIDGLNFRYAFK